MFTNVPKLNPTMAVIQASNYNTTHSFFHQVHKSQYINIYNKYGIHKIMH